MPLLSLAHVDSQQEVDMMPNTEPGTASCPWWPPLYPLSLPLPPDCSQLFHVSLGPAELWGNQRSSAALPQRPGPAWSLHQQISSLSSPSVPALHTFLFAQLT